MTNYHQCSHHTVQKNGLKMNHRYKHKKISSNLKAFALGFPGAVVKNLPANAGDTGSSPGPGRSHMPWSN